MSFAIGRWMLMVWCGMSLPSKSKIDFVITYTMKKTLWLTISLGIASGVLMTCSRRQATSSDVSTSAMQVGKDQYQDTAFWQELHDAYPVIKNSEALSV